MKFLLDQGIPRSAATHLRASGFEAVHVADLQMSTATDEQILNKARERCDVIVTLDADFHTILVLGSHASPSVIRIRIEKLKGDAIAQLVATVVANVGLDIENGAMVTIDENGARIKQLPVQTSQ
ncbi:MAG: DUF5615 family PIN-like protein [Phycisphaerales bacterium]